MKYAKCRYDATEYWGKVTADNIQLCQSMLEPSPHSAFPTPIPLDEVELLAPCEATTIVCVGKNYAKHIKEMAGVTGGGEVPQEPGLFLKAVNSLASHESPVAYPNWTDNLHYEGELALVIKRTMRNIAPDDALDYVLGYTCALDVSARDKQRSDLQWVRAKSADTFCPLGPWLETELDPSALNLHTRVNGEVRQAGNTRDLIFNIPTILSYISQFMTLHAGDVVLTGTPEGVGPLQVGDVVEVALENIGTLRNTIVQADATEKQ